MINRRQWMLLAGTAAATLPLGKLSIARAAADAEVQAAVDAAVKPVIAQYGVPGLAVGVTLDGARHFFDYGWADVRERIPVTRDTLFELGSISKTFTATLAALAEIEGKLALTDAVGQHMPELKSSPIGDVRLLDLGTHTAGGFPLQLPDAVKTPEQLITWYRAWKPKYPAGSMRTYANPSIALLGFATARAMAEDFTALMESRLFTALGLQRTYIDVPEKEMPTYAWGTSRDGKPLRMGASPIAAEAWGVKSNAVDMLQLLEVSMGLGQVPDPIARAVAATHTGYYRTGPYIQDLVWEQYPTPARLDVLTEGNSSQMSMKPNPATPIEPPMPPRGDVILNKTGSTAGFGAYVFCMPEKKLGIVLLANKFYPNEARTKVAWQVMERMVG